MTQTAMIVVSDFNRGEYTTFIWNGKIVDEEYLASNEKGRGPYHQGFCFLDTEENRTLLAKHAAETKIAQSMIDDSFNVTLRAMKRK